MVLTSEHHSLIWVGWVGYSYALLAMATVLTSRQVFLRPAVTGTVMAAALAATLRGIIEVSAEHGARTHLIVTLPDMATRTTTTSG